MKLQDRGATSDQRIWAGQDSDEFPKKEAVPINTENPPSSFAISQGRSELVRGGVVLSSAPTHFCIFRYPTGLG